jgi:predicted DNA-binding transcriptional regulator AlpA
LPGLSYYLTNRKRGGLRLRAFWSATACAACTFSTSYPPSPTNRFDESRTYVIVMARQMETAMDKVQKTARKMRETNEGVDFVRRPKAAAERLGVCPRTLRRMELRGEFGPRTQITERIYGFRDSTINQYLDSRTAN